METFSGLLAICAGNSPVTGEFPAQRPVTRSLLFSLICAWISSSVSNREAGHLRRHRTHYDVTVMDELVPHHKTQQIGNSAPRSHGDAFRIAGHLWESLKWSHNGRDGVSNRQHHDCLLKRLFRHGSKKTSKVCVTGLCAGNSPVTGEFPAQMGSNAENAPTWWRRHVPLTIY